MKIFKPIANRCYPRIKWLIGAAAGSEALTNTNLTKEAEEPEEQEPEDDIELVSSSLAGLNSSAGNETEIDNRDFKQENFIFAKADSNQNIDGP